MPKIVYYGRVLTTLQSQGLKCHYYNSGAFGFDADVSTISRGWIGPEDGSIREAARPLVRRVSAPFAQRLTAGLLKMRQGFLAGPVWAMPKSHWAYEIEYGSAAWMPGLIRDIGLNPDDLARLTDASAIEFSDAEDHLLIKFVNTLLDGLHGSDFLIAFPGRRSICTIHSHLQLWWTTADSTVAGNLDEVLSDLDLTDDVSR